MTGLGYVDPMPTVLDVRPADRDGPAEAGRLLRSWRERRRLSQLELAGRAGVSARHLSFVETGRSRPTAEMVLRLCGRLDVPLREQNRVLLAAGFAPAHPVHALAEPEMSAVHDAVERVLEAHVPYPALVIDQAWDLVAANDPVYGLLAGVSPRLLEPPVNVVRLTLHPDGLAPRIGNLGQWRAHLLDRLAHDLAASGDARLEELLEEAGGYPGPADPGSGSGALVVPLRLRTADGDELSLFSTTTVFGTPREVTLSELAIESFYPADTRSRSLLTALAGGVSGPPG
jgi:transcriptional regulator with XRE-family HTH domain